MTETISSAEYKDLQFQITPQMKYRNVKTVIDGITFDSKKEAAYYQKRQALLKSGDIVKLEMQVRYDFVINGVKLGFYKADFRETWASGTVVVVDVKGFKPPVYNLKKKLMLALHRIVIKDV